MTEETKQKWRERIQDWIDSGLVAEEYADRIGVSVRTLENNKYMLEREERILKNRNRKTPHPDCAGFVEITDAHLSSPVKKPSIINLAKQTNMAAEPLEIVLSDGLRIRVPVTFDENTLKRLVKAMEER